LHWCLVMLTYTNTTQCRGPCFSAFVVKYSTMRWIHQCQNGISENINVQPMQPPICEKGVRFLCCWRCRSRIRSQRWEFFRTWLRGHRKGTMDVEVSHIIDSTLSGITVQYQSRCESTSIRTRLRFGDGYQPELKTPFGKSTKSQITPVS
jgi:hypothetical protein